MAGASVPSARAAGRRAVDSNINMVPMIDLLISVIAFLLITAAWIRMGVVQAQQPRGGDPVSPVVDRLKIAITESEFQVGITAVDMQHVARGPDGLARLRTVLGAFHHEHAGERDVLLQPDSAVRYDDVVQVMDVVYAVWGSGASAGERTSDRVRVQFL
jgi:biopolymer transport protein ExbD